MLVVVDVQNDYATDVAPGPGQQHTTIAPRGYTQPLRPLAARIAGVAAGLAGAGDGLDLVVFTRDWLGKVWRNDDGVFTLTAGSWGTEVLPEARAAALPAGKAIDFLKSRDDWMTSDRGFFDHGWERRGAAGPATLTERIGEELGVPEPAAVCRLVVVGIQRNRCVMKGVVHARQLGFEVAVVREGCDGGAEDRVDRWVEGPAFVLGDRGKWDGGRAAAEPLDRLARQGYHNAPRDIWSHPTELAAAVAAHGEPAVRRDWMRQVYEMMGDDFKGGPTVPTAWEVMRNAGARVVDSVADLGWCGPQRAA